jgi:putative cell wall-binding protein
MPALQDTTYQKEESKMKTTKAELLTSLELCNRVAEERLRIQKELEAENKQLHEENTALKINLINLAKRYGATMADLILATADIKPDEKPVCAKECQDRKGK